MANITPKRFWELMKIHAQMDLASLMRDRTYMMSWIAADIISNVSSVAGIFLLAWKFDGIGSLDRWEVLFMLAYANVVMGFLSMCGSPNALFVSRIIGRGQWEHMYIMPLPYPTALAMGFFPFTCSSTFVTGVVLMGVSLAQMNLALPWWWGSALVGSIAVSMAIVTALSYLLSSLAFFAPVQCEEIATTVLSSVQHTMGFPLSGMPGYVKYPLLTIFPAGLTAWYPTMLLLGKTGGAGAVYPAVFAVLLALVTSYVFGKGLKYYAKVGINRYSSGGHRC